MAASSEDNTNTGACTDTNLSENAMKLPNSQHPIMDYTSFGILACELLKQGAEAKLYSGTFFGRPVIVKERFIKSYRHHKLDERLTKERMRMEIRSIAKCHSIGVNVPYIYHADFHSKSIVMEKIENSITARDFITMTTDTQTLNKLGATIGSTIYTLHKNLVIHGDLTTSNILVATDGEMEVVMIDFGLSFSSGNAEDKAVDLYVLERAFLSTHPNSEKLFAIILTTYEKQCDTKKCKEVMKKLDEVRLRGRKRNMVG